MYNELVKALFFHPQHTGTLDVNASGVICVTIGSRKQGLFALYVQTDAKAKVIKARFKAFGNPYLIASLEKLCTVMENKTVDTLSALKASEWAQELQIPAMNYPVVLQVEKGLKAVCQRFAEE